MAADVGGLIADIGLDVAALRADIKAANSTLATGTTSMNRSLFGLKRSVDSAVGSFRMMAGGLGIGFVVRAISNFTRDAIQAADAIGETAKAAGFGAERFQRLSFVFRQNGVEAQEFDAAMRTSNTRLGQFITTGAGPAAKAIEQLGLKQRIANGEIRNNEQLVDAVIAALGKIESGAERAAIAAAFFGREIGVKMQDTLGRGAEAINAAADAATGVFTDDTVAKASATADAMERLGSATWNWVKGLAVAATYELGKTFGVDEIAALEATAERRLATLRERQRTLHAFGNQRLSPAEQTELDDLEAQIANRRRFRTGGGFGFSGEFGERSTGMRADGRPSESHEGLSEIQSGDKLMAGLKRFDFAGASAAVLNTELQEITAVVVKMPEDLKKLSPEFNTATEALREYKDNLKDASLLGKTLGMSLQDSLADAMLGIETNWKDMIKRMLAQAAASKLLSFLGASATGPLGAVFGFLGFGGGKASGGPVEGGKSYIVGEEGPELVRFGRSGHVTPNHALGGVTQNINVYLQAGLPQQIVAELEQIGYQAGATAGAQMVGAAMKHRPSIA